MESNFLALWVTENVYMGAIFNDKCQPIKVKKCLRALGL